MKALKYLMLVLVASASLSACTVREHRAGYIPGHYEYGQYGHRHWVRGHYK